MLETTTEYEIETLPGFTEDDVNTKVGNLEIVPLHPNDPLGIR